MSNHSDTVNLAKAMNVLRIMRQRGAEKAIQYFPEMIDFIEFYSSWNIDAAERDVLNDGHLDLLMH